MTARLLTAALLLLSSTRSDALQSYVARVPNGASVPGVAALGHVDPAGGGARNAFGEAFASAGHRWTLALCLADSDGDGQTNGQELGDPCCVWQGGKYDTATFTTGVSHPGDAKSTVDPAILYQWVCGYHNVSGSVSGDLGANPAPSGANSTAASTVAPSPAPDAGGSSGRSDSGTPSPPGRVLSASLVVALLLSLG